MASNKEIVLGVTGSIAAYKACEIASQLVKRGFTVTPVLTRSAQELVTRASLEALTGQRVITDLFEPLVTPEIEHIAVARRASLFLIAPATANIMAKAAHGIADDWLSTTLLATRAPILFAPAMNTLMYQHEATQANIQTLKSRGCRFIGPASGRLACGDIGEGRMTDPQTIAEYAALLATASNELAGRRVLITNGGTREPIDPVRFIGNHSSGKMGRAIATAALRHGADVTVVQAHAEVSLPYGVDCIPVSTALEMEQAVVEHASQADIIIGVAAVADYRVDQPALQKHKRTGETITLNLVENPDIIACIASSKRPGQIVVGFAAETNDVIPHALQKCRAKQLNLVVANQVGTTTSGFGTDTTDASFVFPDGSTTSLPLGSTKEQLAEQLMTELAGMLPSRA